MPLLDNPKHELFAQGLAMGLSADDAYAKAGFKAHRGNASTLRANKNIADRVREIIANVSEKAEWSAADRLSALKRISNASEGGDPRVAVSAIAEANKMCGSHAPTRREHSGPMGQPIRVFDVTRLKGMSDEQLELLDQALTQLGIADDEEE